MNDLKTQTIMTKTYTIKNFAKRLVMVLAVELMAVNTWGTVLFREDFGNNSSSARAWSNDYITQSGVSAVYSGATSYTVTNAKQSKNTMGHGTQTSQGNTDGGSAIVSNQGNQGTVIIGPLNVASYESLALTHWFGKSSAAADTWNESRASNPDVMKVSYSTNNSTWIALTRTGSNPNSGAVGNTTTNHNYVQASYTLPAAAQVSTLYLKFEFYCYKLNNSSQQIGAVYIDEVELTGTAAGYAVTYNNGGHGTAPSNTTASAVTLSAITGVTGYICTGWKANVAVTNTSTSASISAGTLIPNGTGVTLSQATTFTAQWSANQYTVTLNDNTGSGGSGSKTVTYNANTNLTTSVAVPTKAHHDFAGYWTSTDNGATFGTKLVNADGSWVASVTNYTDASKNWIKADNVTLYAKWTEHSLTNYRTVCCTELGTIEGEATLTQGGNSVTISGWSDVSNVGTYTVKLYKKNGASWDLVSGTTSGGSAGAQGTRTGITSGSKSVTYTGLEVESEYKFTVQAIAGSSAYCDGVETAVTEINDVDVSSTPFKFRYSIYIDNGSNSGWAHHYITPTGNTNEGSVDITLAGPVDYYQFKIGGGFSGWWGQTGESKYTTGGTQWTLDGSQNVKMQTWIGGTYTFTVDYSGTTNPKVTITYPSANQDAGNIVYWDASVVANWDHLHFRVGTDGNANAGSDCKTDLQKVPGTDNFYKVTTASFTGMRVWAIANNTGWTGSNTNGVYKTNTGDGYAVTLSSDYQDYVVGEDGVTLVPYGSGAMGSYSHDNNCRFYTVTKTDGMLTHNVSLNSPAHGTLLVTYTNTSGTTGQTVTEGNNADLAHRCILTITATPDDGYTCTSLTVNSSNFTSGSTHILAADATIAATFTAQTSTVTLDNNNATSGSQQTVTATYDATMPLVTTADGTPAVAALTRTGYTFNGWWDETSGGNQYYTYSGSPKVIASARTWDKTGAQTLKAQWIVNQYTLTWDLQGGTVATAGTGAAAAATGTPSSSQDYGTALTAPVVTKTGYNFNVWSPSVAATMPPANTTYTASWTAQVYNITYKDQGDVAYSGNATAGVPTGAPTTHTYGSATDLVNGVKDGYRFDGWFTDASCTVSAGSSIGATAKTADFTLYAKWTQVYTVTWSVNGSTWSSGVVEGNTHVISGEKVSALPTAPTKSDCDDSKVFVGWRATEIDGTSASDPGGIFTNVAGSPEISADKTFYAVFADASPRQVISLTFPDDNSDNNGLTSNQYTSEWTAKAGTFSFTVNNFNNNNWGGSWEWIKCGRMSYTSVAKITTDTDVDFRVDSVYITIGSIADSYVNSAKLQISSSSDFGTKTEMDIPQSTGTQKLKIASPATDKYYRIVYDCASHTSSNGFVQINSLEFIQKSETSNYVTTCASCDENATFTNTTPAVSDIDCTSATLTATGGLATVGADGCHVSDYGFVIGTSDNPVIGGSGVTKLQVGTSDPTIGEDFSYEATDLTKGTHYYIRAYAINRHGTAYSTSTNFWTKNVSSIAITTAPTKTNYIVGETFDATGMVVTATMASGSTEAVTGDVTYSESALTAGASQNFPVNYTLCETEKSVNQVINVYTLTVTEGTNPSYGDYSTSANVITVNPGSGKTYSLSVTNATAVDNLDGTHTITNPTGNVTVTINYRDATTVKVYYKVDGKTVIEQDVTESTTATLPTASDVVTALAANDLELPEGTIYTNLWGWSESEFTPQTDEPTIVNSPTINATKTFYAVYTNMYKKSIVGSVFSGTYSDNDGEQTIDGLTYQVSNICKQSEQIQFRSTPGYLYSKTALSYIREIKISGLDLVVNACSDNSGTVDGSAITPVGTAPYIYTFPDNKQYFKITGNKGETDKVSRIDIYYATATPYYMTTFCDDKVAAPTVTDTKSYTATNKATVTLSWDEVSGATGYKVKWGSVSNSWEDVGTALTYSKENLSSGSTYKWFVKAKYDAENDCGAEIAKGSTTVNTAYEVAYDANTTGYTGTEPDGGFYESGETITISSTALSKSRYHFDGWTPYNTSTSAAISVTTGTFTMPAADVLIQGGWTEVLSGDEVYITSAKDITTMSSMDIVVERATYKSGTMTISDETGGQGGTFHAVIDGATADASDGLLATVKIEYTPNKANVTESATMTAVVGSESYDFTVYGRSLPTDFVIVAKVGAVWTALPADATTSGLQLGYSLTLDDATTPTKATLAPAAALFNYYAKSAKTTTDYIRLASKENSKALWSSTSNGIKVYAAIGGGSATGNQYEWKLSTNNNATYTLHNDAAGSGSGRDLGVNSDNKWGMHASATTSELRFLPVDATADYIAMTVTSWGEYSFTFTTSDVIPSHDHVAVECNGVSYAASMTGSGPYTISIPLMDFSDYSGASLVVQWISDEDVVLAQGAVLMPIFITSDNTDFEGYDPDILAVTDVHITNGSTLTITTSGISVHDLSIEGGSTLNISKTAGDAAVTFGVNSLYLRGGWNETYTTYDMPRVYIDPKSTLTKSQNAVNFDISVDSRNYYPFAVPFRVKVSDINYANSTLAYYAQYGATGQYVIKEYDGARRAENGPDQQNNWKVVPKKDNENNDVYLEPGRGYIMTAVSLPAYGGGVIRIPLSFANSWTAKGEQGTIDKSYYKNVVPVEAYAKAEGETKNANKGWNLLGVPFMSCYGTGAGMYDEDNVDDPASIIQGKFNFEDGTWDGEDKVRYVNVPVHDFSEYIQTDITDAGSVLRPGWCFFVQIETSGNLKFLTADQAASSSLPIYAPKRGMKADMPTVETGIILSNGEKSDKTTFLVSDKYNGAEYEINADLEKMFGNGYTLATYSLAGNTRLAYNAMSNADAANIIPIGYRAPAEGEYTFAINPKYAENGAFEQVNLIDYETGSVTDLLQYSYSFSTDRTQNDARFAINVVKQKETPTDIENIQGDNVQGTNVRKLLIDGKVYIIRGGQMYDATGKQVKGGAQ